MTAPLTPKDCDLRDFDFMTLDVRRLLKSDTWIEAAEDPRLGHALMTLWAECWHQVPAASLPSSDVVLARLAMCDAAEWDRIKPRALAGWVQCDDGRLYHPVVAEKALDAYARRAEFRETASNRTERQRRWRERSREICVQLRGMGITPPGGAKLAELEAMLVEAETTRDATVDATVDAKETGGKHLQKRLPNRLQSVSETHKTETVDIYSVAKATGAGAPPVPSAIPAAPDWRSLLFRDGLRIVVGLTGKPEAGTRALIGRWLKASRDDCRQVLRVIEDARDTNPADPVAWIEAALSGPRKPRTDSMAFVMARA